MKESVKTHYADTEQALIELIAEFLDDQQTGLGEIWAGIKDPVSREKSELHIRMAQAAMNEYKNTVK